MKRIVIELYHILKLFQSKLCYCYEDENRKLLFTGQECAELRIP